MSKNKHSDSAKIIREERDAHEAPVPPAAPPLEAVTPKRGPAHDFIKIGGNPGKNQIYKCQQCGYQTMATVENAPPNPFTPACFVAPLAGPVKTP